MMYCPDVVAKLTEQAAQAKRWLRLVEVELEGEQALDMKPINPRSLAAPCVERADDAARCRIEVL